MGRLQQAWPSDTESVAFVAAVSFALALAFALACSLAWPPVSAGVVGGLADRKARLPLPCKPSALLVEGGSREEAQPKLTQLILPAGYKLCEPYKKLEKWREVELHSYQVSWSRAVAVDRSESPPCVRISKHQASRSDTTLA